MPRGKGHYAALALDGRPEQQDDVAILENVCGSPEVILGKQFLAMSWIGSPRHQRPQSSSASRLTAGAFGFLTLIQSGERPRR
jgi:hypothetical protein